MHQDAGLEAHGEGEVSLVGAVVRAGVELLERAQWDGSLRPNSLMAGWATASLSISAETLAVIGSITAS
jgi:hypothetical protein